jgi:hypothetical protein
VLRGDGERHQREAEQLGEVRGLEDDHTDSDAHRDAHRVWLADSHGDRDSDAHADGHRNCDAHGDGDRDCDADADGDRDCDADGDRDAHGNCDTDVDGRADVSLIHGDRPRLTTSTRRLRWRPASVSLGRRGWRSPSTTIH